WDIISTRHVFEAQLPTHELRRSDGNFEPYGGGDSQGQQRPACRTDRHPEARSSDGTAHGDTHGGKDAARTANRNPGYKSVWGRAHARRVAACGAENRSAAE